MGSSDIPVGQLAEVCVYTGSDDGARAAGGFQGDQGAASNDDDVVDGDYREV